MLYYVSLTGNATLDPSTVFVDYLGDLGGSSAATWNGDAANKAVDAERLQIQTAVRAGYIARAAADWHVSVLTESPFAFCWSLRLCPQLHVVAYSMTSLQSPCRSSCGAYMKSVSYATLPDVRRRIVGLCEKRNGFTMGVSRSFKNADGGCAAPAVVDIGASEDNSLCRRWRRVLTSRTARSGPSREVHSSSRPASLMSPSCPNTPTPSQAPPMSPSSPPTTQ